MRKLVLLLLVLALVAPSTSFAKKRKKYEAVEVTNGGSIKGVIKASSKVADPVMKIETKKPEEVKYCGKDFQAGKYVISSDMGVKNVVVALLKVKKGKAMPKKDYVLDNVKCQFTPLVGVAFKKNNYVIKNSDPVFHNTSMGLQLKNKRSTVYNLALPNQNQVIKKPIRRTGLHSVKCDAHPWMRGFLYAAKNPYATLTDDSGSFEITDVLPGKYKVMIWHEGFGEVKKEIEVTAGGTAALDHTF